MKSGPLDQKRWADIPGAIYDGTLHIGDAAIPCAVLEDGRRVLTQSGVMQALGRARQAKGRRYYDGDVNLPAFLTAKNLKPFIPNDLYVTSSQIEFRRVGGGKAFHKTLRVTPAMAAGIGTTVLDMDWIVEMIDEAAPKPGPRGQYKPRTITG